MNQYSCYHSYIFPCGVFKITFHVLWIVISISSYCLSYGSQQRSTNCFLLISGNVPEVLCSCFRSFFKSYLDCHSLNFHSCLHIGHCWWIGCEFNHLRMQCMWKTCEHCPHTVKTKQVGYSESCRSHPRMLISQLLCRHHSQSNDRTRPGNTLTKLWTFISIDLHLLC